MWNLFRLIESFTSGYEFIYLNFLFLVAIFCSILVITSKNPIISVLFLICLFLGISTYLMLVGASFIGLSYLLVYVGAVSILFLFILMLINVRISELVSDSSNAIPLVLFVTMLFNITLYGIIPALDQNFFDWFDHLKLLINNANQLILLHPISKHIIANDVISYVTSLIWDQNLGATSHISTIGMILYVCFPLWIILISIILLLAMIGAIVITIRQKH